MSSRRSSGTHVCKGARRHLLGFCRAGAGCDGNAYRLLTRPCSRVPVSPTSFGTESKKGTRARFNDTYLLGICSVRKTAGRRLGHLSHEEPRDRYCRIPTGWVFAQNVPRSFFDKPHALGRTMSAVVKQESCQKRPKHLLTKQLARLTRDDCLIVLRQTDDSYHGNEQTTLQLPIGSFGSCLPPTWHAQPLRLPR